jgi:hypothetical protein
LLQLDDVHTIRPVGGLGGARVGDRLVHSAHKFEHDLVLLERKLLLVFDTLDQFLRTGSACKRQYASPTNGTHRWGPKEQRIIFLRAIKVRPSGIAREGFDTLLERQDVPDHLPDAVRVCQTNTLGFRNQEIFEQLAYAFESKS